MKEPAAEPYSFENLCNHIAIDRKQGAVYCRFCHSIKHDFREASGQLFDLLDGIENLDRSCSQSSELGVKVRKVKELLAAAPVPVLARPSRRQIVFDWLMQDKGYWGGAEEVARVDELLRALDAAPPLRSEESLSRELVEKIQWTMRELAGAAGSHHSDAQQKYEESWHRLEELVAALASRSSSSEGRELEKIAQEAEEFTGTETWPNFVKWIRLHISASAEVRASAPRTESLAKTYEAVATVYQAVEETSMGPRELSPPDPEFELGEKISCGSTEGRASNTPTACTDAEGDKHHSGYQAPPAGTQPTAAGGEQGEKIDK